VQEVKINIIFPSTLTNAVNTMNRGEKVAVKRLEKAGNRVKE